MTFLTQYLKSSRITEQLLEYQVNDLFPIQDTLPVIYFDVDFPTLCPALLNLADLAAIPLAFERSGSLAGTHPKLPERGTDSGSWS